MQTLNKSISAGALLNNSATQAPIGKSDTIVQNKFTPISAEQNEKIWHSLTENIIKYIYDEIKANTSDNNKDFTNIKKLLKTATEQTLSAKLTPHPNIVIFDNTYWWQANLEFKKMVGYGRPWDHKKTILDRWGKFTKYYGHSIGYDMWSNIHYGFVGSMLGFTSFYLLEMAGLFQAIKSDIPGGISGAVQRLISGDAGILSSLDDPLDRQAIKIGIEMSQRYGNDLEIRQLQQYFKSNIHRISSK